ncbi:Tyrosine permease [Cardiobacterium hominis]|uniref:Aromatic amino acid permease n=1 Tax=Cardiobacterium hominis (strain ATCC 15826 / DSM 8339 / NCTC 10426 / 6573) TaxID=638300 RepID=C8N966_CARH6|nr:aromatic amino acid transport family protein [Cardiobacterium hominis]EEV88843.1 aromatic amino acid transport protein [Cardiobacterium hominis ATCC 15826]VEG76424.1 Tyrosine permease [Cardiobacterium hominis]
MNKTLGTTLLVSGTMIGAGMLAMPLTSAGIGFTFTVVLLISLWILLTYSALLFVEVYQTTESDSGIGTLSALYFGNAGRVVSTTVMFVFLYALLAAYISGGGEILMKATQSTGLLGQEGVIANTSPEMTLKIFIGIFTVFFGSFVIISTKVVDGFNRLLFFVMLVALVVVMFVMFPKASVQNLMAMPLDNALIISAAPIFFTSYGFHGSIPSLVKYMEGDVRGLRIAIVTGSAITLVGYILWQLSTHGVLSQGEFTQILKEKPTLYGLIEACRRITGSEIIASAVQLFSALALVTSFLGVALGLFDCTEDMLRKGLHINAGRLLLGAITFLPPVLFAYFYPDFIAALSYAGQMFAFFAVVLPVGLVWKARRRYPNLPYRVAGGDIALIIALVIGIVVACIPFFVKAGMLPPVVG